VCHFLLDETLYVCKCTIYASEHIIYVLVASHMCVNVSLVLGMSLMCVSVSLICISASLMLGILLMCMSVSFYVQWITLCA
jgi:hypothetical protein